MQEVSSNNLQSKSLLQRFECWAYNLENGDLKKLKEMIYDGFLDPNESLINGLTPLHIACIQGSLNGTKFLLNFGVDFDALSLSERTPIDEALLYKHFDCAIEIMIHKENHNSDFENKFLEQFLLFQ